jgi:hypothetical protein
VIFFYIGEKLRLISSTDFGVNLTYPVFPIGGTIRIKRLVPGLSPGSFFSAVNGPIDYIIYLTSIPVAIAIFSGVFIILSPLSLMKKSTAA